MSDLNAEAEKLFKQYIECWNRHDLEGVAACFDEPSMFVLPTGAVPLPDRKAVVSLLEQVFAGLTAAGFSHSTIGSIKVTTCGEGLSILDATDVCRLKADGTLLEKIDAHYVLRRHDGEWRFAVVVPCTSGWRSA